MTDLDATIRAKLARQRSTMTVDGEFINEIAGDWEDALLAALDLHARDQQNNCTECREGGPGYEAEHVEFPCPTVRAIAEKLGIET